MENDSEELLASLERDMLEWAFTLSYNALVTCERCMIEFVNSLPAGSFDSTDKFKLLDCAVSTQDRLQFIQGVVGINAEIGTPCPGE